MAGFTTSGYQRDTLQALVEEERQKLQTIFGLTINIDDEESVFYQIATNNAERRFQNQQTIEEIISNLSIAGAEGIYLDNILNKVVTRLSPTQGTVDAYIEYGVTPLSQAIPVTTLINTKDGRKYYPIEELLLYDHVVAFSISRTDLKTNGNGAVYTFNATKADGTSAAPLSITVSNINDNTELDSELANIRTWFVSTVGVPSNRASTSNGATKIGYDSLGNIVGFGWESEFSVTGNIGTKNSLIPARHEKAGYYPINPNTVSSSSPSFTGYVRASNPYAGTSGTDTESDAEYIVRHREIALDPIDTTREGVVRALQAAGLTKVAVQSIPASVTAPYTHALGFTVYPSPSLIIFTSGSPSEGTIGETIYNSIPAGVDTSGDESESITPTASGGQVIAVRWTEATNVNYDFRVNYTALTGGSFSSTEQTLIKQAITDVLDTIEIGGTVYTTQLDTAILKALPTNRLLLLQTYGRVHGVGSYVTGAITLASTGTYFSTQDDYITFLVV